LNGDFGWYVFLGTQGRAVGHNIFLDGNSVRESASVEKKPLVADFMVAQRSSGRLQYVSILPSPTYKRILRPTGHPDRFGGVNLVLRI